MICPRVRVGFEVVWVRRALLALVCAAVLSPGPRGAAEPRALAVQTIVAARANQAGVVIDKGDGSAPVELCVRFDGPMISGEEALLLAAARDPSMEPVFSEYSGMGKAVCALYGIGRPSGDCFGDPQRYWAYSRAEAGTAAFRTSPVGVSSSEVTDGDVEGYRWGSGAPPAFADIRTICGEAEAEATPTTSGPASTVAPRPAPPPSGSTGTAPPDRPPPSDASAPTAVAPPAPAQAPTPPTPSDLRVPAAPTTTSPPRDVDRPDPDESGSEERDPSVSDDDGDGELASVRLTPEGETGGGGSGLALAGVGATFAALVAGSVALQRARRSR